MKIFRRVIKIALIVLAVLLVVAAVKGVTKTAGKLGSFFDREMVTPQMQTYDVTSGVSDLDLRIGAADISIREGEAFAVESNLKHLKVEERDGTLIIKETKKFHVTDYVAELTVYVPAGTVFDSVKFETGAGRLTVDRLSAAALDFELGAGDVSIGTLTATNSADIEGGAGRITVGGGMLENLDLEMGVGQLNLTAALTGDCQMDLGVGQSNITLQGNKEDYRLELAKGVGKITVDGQEVVHYEAGSTGTNRVEINGGVGAIDVKFEDAGLQ